MTDPLSVTDRSRLRRTHERGFFDRKTIYQVLDAMPLCHVGYIMGGAPVVIPTLQWREKDTIYWHGSAASRSLRAGEGQQVSLTVSLLDGFVLARSGFHHSVNYRSAMLFGQAEKVEGPDEKIEKLNNLVDAYFPGRAGYVRAITAQEAKATTILRMPIEEGSAKIRAGGPVDDEEDYGLPIWAGVVPASIVLGSAEPDPRNLPGVDAPDHLRKIRLG